MTDRAGQDSTRETERESPPDSRLHPDLEHLPREHSGFADKILADFDKDPPDEIKNQQKLIEPVRQAVEGTLKGKPESIRQFLEGLSQDDEQTAAKKIKAYEDTLKKAGLQVSILPDASPDEDTDATAEIDADQNSDKHDSEKLKYGALFKNNNFFDQEQTLYFTPKKSHGGFTNIASPSLSTYGEIMRGSSEERLALQDFIGQAQLDQALRKNPYPRS